MEEAKENETNVVWKDDEMMIGIIDRIILIFYEV